MYRLSVLLVVILTTLSVGASSARVSKERLVSQGKDRTYYLFLPENVAHSSPAPLILLLHGSGRNGLSLVDKWKDLAARDGIILAGPDSMDSAVWQTPGDGPAFLRDLIDSLKSKYPIDARRVYLFGHSAGAGFALRMSLFESEYFAATAIHAGALRPEGYDVIDYAVRKIPISVFVGTNDPLFPLPLVRGTVAALNAKRFDTNLSEIRGHDHNYYVRSAEINREAWAFLKQYRLEKDPQYTPFR